MADPRYSVTLAKEDFKFAAAHFTLFPDRPAELLHGHNYRVSLELEGEQLDAHGLLVDLTAVKRRVRECCALLDERTLIPERAPALRIERGDDQVSIRFQDRSYALPAPDVRLLPLENVSMELLARLLWREIAPALAGSRVRAMALTLHETAGQSATYRAPLGGAPDAG
jgi:6-pyruvoyltetrahydropterin/6-carboxytetrahydropterin synthase